MHNWVSGLNSETLSGNPCKRHAALQKVRSELAEVELIRNVFDDSFDDSVKTRGNMRYERSMFLGCTCAFS